METKKQRVNVLKYTKTKFTSNNLINSIGKTQARRA